MRALLPCLVLLSLAACDPKPTTIVANNSDDDMQAQLAKAKPVTLPPSISASKTFRCADNSVVSVDYYSDGRSALVKAGDADAGTKVSAAAPGGALTAPGISVKGGADSDSATIEVPGHKSQRCDAK